MALKFIYNEKNFISITTRVEDEIFTPLDESYKNICKILEELSEDNLAWQGRQKDEFIAFLDLTIQYHADLLQCIEDFHADLGVITEKVNEYAINSTRYKKIAQ